MKRTASDYFDKYQDRYDKEYEAYQNGAYTEAEFNAWVQTQVARGKGYEEMADKLSKRIVEADKVASAYINDATPSVYSLNHNYEAYRICNGENIDFQLVDEQTVKELMNDNNHTEFKTTSINPVRDYEWNSRKIHNALTSAILQGKSIDKLADSYYSVMKSDRASAVRNARTSFTSAQNAGRLESYNKATQMGITLSKEWISTLDGRTRDSHAHLDGERVAHDKPFSNGLMYPADPEGAPAEVYNCRCTMRAIMPHINDRPRETYSDWIKTQTVEEIKIENGEFYKIDNVSKGLAKALTDNLINAESDAVELFNKYVGDCKVVKNDHIGTAYYSPKEKGIIINEQAILEGDVCHSPLNTAYHELAHNIDYNLGSGSNYYSVEYKDGAIYNSIMNDYKKLVDRAYNAEETVYNNISKWIDSGLLTETNIYSSIRQADTGDGVLKELSRTYRRNKTPWKQVWEENKEIIIKDFDNTSDTKKGKLVIEMIKEDLKSEGIDIRSVEGKRAISCVSDMVEGLTGSDYPLGVGHGSNYYKYAQKNNLTKELWAEVIADKSSYENGIELTRKYFGEAVSTVEEAIKDIT